MERLITLSMSDRKTSSTHNRAAGIISTIQMRPVRFLTQQAMHTSVHSSYQ